MSYDKVKEKNSQMVWELVEFICFKYNVQFEFLLVWLVLYWQSKIDEGLWRVCFFVVFRNNMILIISDIVSFKFEVFFSFYEQDDLVKGCIFFGSLDFINKIKCYWEGK